MILKIFLSTLILFSTIKKPCVSCEIELYEKLLTTPHDTDQDLSLIRQIKTKYGPYGWYLPRLGRMVSSEDKIDIQQEIEEEVGKEALLSKKRAAIIDEGTESTIKINECSEEIMRTENNITGVNSRLRAIERQKPTSLTRCIAGCCYPENEDAPAQECSLREQIVTLEQKKIRLDDQRRLLTETNDKLEEEKKVLEAQILESNKRQILLNEQGGASAFRKPLDTEELASIDFSHIETYANDVFNIPVSTCYKYEQYGSLRESKGIIIDYYGGNWTSSTQPPRIPNSAILRQGYCIMQLYTNDAWQDIQQRFQFRTQEGKKLLSETVMTFLLFTQAIKKSHPDKPIYYLGASFGGTKGAFINLILSNKDDLASIFGENFQDVADQFDTFFKQNSNIDASLIRGFILHDGAYSRFTEENVFRKQYVRMPTLLLHNFDDDRVPIKSTLDFYKVLKNDGVSDGYLSLFITPQGAKSHIQTLDETECSSSADGHQTPILMRYKQEYDERIFTFLKDPMDFVMTKGGIHFHSTQNQNRYDHFSRLWSPEGSSIATFIYKKSYDRMILYRLYYANLHNEQPHEKISIFQRLQRTFAQKALYDQDNLEFTFEIEDYNELIRANGQWLINGIIVKNQKSKKAVGALWAKNKERVLELLQEAKVAKQTAGMSAELCSALTVSAQT